MSALKSVHTNPKADLTVREPIEHKNSPIAIGHPPSPSLYKIQPSEYLVSKNLSQVDFVAVIVNFIKSFKKIARLITVWNHSF